MRGCFRGVDFASWDWRRLVSCIYHYRSVSMRLRRPDDDERPLFFGLCWLACLRGCGNVDSFLGMRSLCCFLTDETCCDTSALERQKTAGTMRGIFVLDSSKKLWAGRHDCLEREKERAMGKRWVVVAVAVLFFTTLRLWRKYGWCGGWNVSAIVLVTADLIAALIATLYTHNPPLFSRHTLVFFWFAVLLFC